MREPRHRQGGVAGSTKGTEVTLQSAPWVDTARDLIPHFQMDGRWEGGEEDDSLHILPESFHEL